MIRTKLIATLGPACDTEPTIGRLIEEGTDVFRLNFSHGTLDDHAQSLAGVRRASERLGRVVAIMGDLCGPKVRLGPIVEQSESDQSANDPRPGMPVDTGETLIIQRQPIEGTGGRVSTNYENFVDEVQIGHRVLIDDGQIRLLVTDKTDDHVACRCISGGVIHSRKGVNLPDTALTLHTITEHDRRCIQWAAEHEVDYLALSFVRHAQDLHQLRELVRRACATATSPTPDAQPHLIAKIEKPEALGQIDAIIEAADGVMIARGDLGVEMDAAKVPIIQKDLIHRCKAAGKPVIVATQMLQSMVHEASPTRAEVSDVANAVFDGADAIMLSGETAIGRDPALAIHTMNHIAAAIEAAEFGIESPEWNTENWTRRNTDLFNFQLTNPDAVLSHGAWQMARHLRVKLVVTWSRTGVIARMFSKLRPRVPVIALSGREHAVRRMAMYFGVHPHRMDVPQSIIELTPRIERMLLDERWVEPGDTILIVGGTVLGQTGKSNAIMVHRVEGLPEESQYGSDPA